MRHRLFSALLIALALAVALAVPASADALGKPQARSKANAKVRNYLANHAWANRARVGKCRQRGKRKVLCWGAARSKQRVCRLRIVVWGKRPRAKLRRGKCSRRLARQLPAGLSPRILRLSAWLGEPGRKALDPFEVTYPHGATTTAQVASLEGEPEPAPTPPGVLALYVDGVLECAANVNEANPEATCPVDYDQLGTYRVTTIYTSGSESAADTILHDVEPLGSSVSLSVSYEPLAEASYLASGCEAETCELPEGFWENADMQLGTLHVTVEEIDPWGGLPKVDCPDGEFGPKAPDGCAFLPSPISPSYALPVIALANLDVFEDQVLVEGELIAAEMQPPKNVTIEGTGISQVPPAVMQAGERFFWARSGAREGYTSSEAAVAIQFPPAATPTIRFR